MHQMFSIRITPEKLKTETVTITGYILDLFEENSRREMIIVKSSFSKSSVFKIFSVYTKTQSQRFQNSSGLKRVFE